MIELPEAAPMAEYQRYIHELERMHGWLEVDLVHNCFLLGEEVGELFKAVRRRLKLYEAEPTPGGGAAATVRVAGADEVAEELVDVLNYLLAIANRLDIDVEAAFRAKNARNQQRTWAP